MCVDVMAELVGDWSEFTHAGGVGGLWAKIQSNKA
jgi:hypothetical protein